MQSTNKKKFRSLNSVLDKVLTSHNLAHLHYIEEIKKEWNNFDKTIASHAEPVRYDANTGILYLKIENILWKKEFLANIETLSIRIKNAFRKINIKNIEIN